MLKKKLMAFTAFILATALAHPKEMTFWPEPSPEPNQVTLEFQSLKGPHDACSADNAFNIHFSRVTITEVIWPWNESYLEITPSQGCTITEVKFQEFLKDPDNCISSEIGTIEGHGRDWVKWKGEISNGTTLTLNFNEPNSEMRFYSFKVTYSFDNTSTPDVDKPDENEPTPDKPQSSKISFPHERVIAVVGRAPAVCMAQTDGPLTLSYSSSDESIAKIDARTGMIKGDNVLQVGKTTITATSEDGSKASYILDVMDNKAPSSSEYSFTTAELNTVVPQEANNATFNLESSDKTITLTFTGDFHQNHDGTTIKWMTGDCLSINSQSGNIANVGVFNKSGINMIESTPEQFEIVTDGPTWKATYIREREGGKRSEREFALITVKIDSENHESDSFGFVEDYLDIEAGKEYEFSTEKLDDAVLSILNLNEEDYTIDSEKITVKPIGIYTLKAEKANGVFDLMRVNVHPQLSPDVESSIIDNHPDGDAISFKDEFTFNFKNNQPFVIRIDGTEPNALSITTTEDHVYTFTSSYADTYTLSKQFHAITIPTKPEISVSDDNSSISVQSDIEDLYYMFIYPDSSSEWAGPSDNISLKADELPEDVNEATVEVKRVKVTSKSGWNIESEVSSGKLVRSSDGIDDITIDNANKNKYFNLNGIKVDRPTLPGVYIVKKGNKTRKIIISK